MTLDPHLCYAAICSRDARFDGRFFTAVATTGIYCRPICPARTPLEANVRFYPSAAAAAAAGFRPCRRCRPESSPGTPAWQGSSTTVRRALRFIEAGALDRMSVVELAERLGVGDRHLRRVFKTHLGASPVAIAQTRRLHFAKKLLDETSLGITEVAHAAGFSSIRRFNAAFKTAFHQSPTQLREGKAARPTERLTLRLSYRPPLDCAGLMAYLGRRAIGGVEAVEGGVYRRSVRFEGDAAGVIEVRAEPDANRLAASIPINLAGRAAHIVERVRRLFDLGADPAALHAHLSEALSGYQASTRVPGAFDGFEMAARVVLGQQISVSAANTFARRLVEAFGQPLPTPVGAVTSTFPTPEALAEAPIEDIGLPGARSRTLRNLARTCAAGELELDRAVDLDEALSTLTALPGIGPWTANVIAMRALGEPDAFPAGDLILRRRHTRGQTVDASTLEASAERWRPYRAYAAMHLWSTET